MSMELQISSGRGPAECELAVGLLACALCAALIVHRRSPVLPSSFALIPDSYRVTAYRLPGSAATWPSISNIVSAPKALGALRPV